MEKLSKCESNVWEILCEKNKNKIIKFQECLDIQKKWKNHRVSNIENTLSKWFDESIQSNLRESSIFIIWIK